MTTYTKAQVKQAVIDALNQSRPVGSYILFAGKTLPTGYLLCNGAAVSRTTYSALFAVIGTTYGAGNGSTTFNLPNLDGRVLQGTNTLSQVGTKLESGLPNITGHWWSYTYINTATSANGAIHSQISNANTGFLDEQTGENTYVNPHFDASWSNSTYGANSKVQNPAIRALVAIRY